MELRSRGDGPVRRPPVPGGPTVEVLFGGDEGGPDVGVVRVEVPPGAGMPEHDHGGSDVVLVALEGAVEISRGDEVIAVGVGDAALVRRNERVALRNPGDGPAAFVAGIRSWPDGTGS